MELIGNKKKTQSYSEQWVEVSVLSDYEMDGITRKKGEHIRFLPLFIQSCMEPDKVRVYPVEVTYGNGRVMIASYEKSGIFPEEKVGITVGNYTHETEKKGCIPCKNCNRC